jgi:hypothetical protein
MAAITKAAVADVKAHVENGAIVHKVQLGATVTAPAPIVLQSDGKWDGLDTSAAQLTCAVALQSGVDTNWVDACFYGPVTCLSGATIGSIVYGSDTAGAFDTAAGTKTTIVGFAMTATKLFVQPDIVDLA